ncbi:sigma-70 family RNA polymerase sigma factor [Puniceicoccaceae bacterium K14]|nr:sigma-70 family RNA polymerase sigma factor [Puniceicoccaceae bacterium K14]
MTKTEREIALQDAHDSCDWLDKYGDYLIQFAYKRTGDLSIAEDLSQETFLAAWNSRFNFKGDSSFKTWLTAILKYKIANYCRKNQNNLPMSKLGELFNQGDNDGSADWVMDESFFPSEWKDCPDRDCELKEAYSMFQHCSNSVPSRFMEVFMFAEVDGLSGEEISAKLKISKSNVWTLLHRAKKALVECMKHFKELLKERF